MNMIVVGCGRVGSQLAYRLYQTGHKVVVVDPVAEAFENLPADFRGRTVEGEVLNQDVLHRAGIEQADSLAAVTPQDPINAVVAHVARTVYHVPIVVVRNYNPRWRVIHEAFGLQVVSSTSWGAQRIEELLTQSPEHTVLSAGHGEVMVCELAVPQSWHGRSLPELLAVTECRPVAVARAGRAVLPTDDMTLEPGDVLYLSTTQAGLDALRAWQAQADAVAAAAEKE
ncbi:MAG: TrkA family potassium uptake protein [Chloroflexi bacterium]|nr:TrkA family potassium uptake protein [Chloroflexota bacterium]MBU1747720.1 TrkA family potassium uptake protein [Chloroflexota bacterium]